MRIDNRTDYSSDDIRRIIQAVCTYDGFVRARNEGGLIRRMIEWMKTNDIARDRIADFAAGQGPFLGYFSASDARRLRNWLVEQPEIVVDRSMDETEAGD